MRTPRDIEPEARLQIFETAEEFAEADDRADAVLWEAIRDALATGEDLEVPLSELSDAGLKLAAGSLLIFRDFWAKHARPVAAKWLTEIRGHVLSEQGRRRRELRELEAAYQGGRIDSEWTSPRGRLDLDV